MEKAIVLQTKSDTFDRRCQSGQACRHCTFASRLRPQSTGIVRALLEVGILEL